MLRWLGRSITTQIFWTILLAAILMTTIALAGVAISLRHGFSYYIAQAQLQQMHGLVRRLEQIYATDGNWDRLRRNRVTWYGMVDRELNQIRDRRARRAAARGHPSLPPLERGQFREGRRLRTVLLDPNGRPIVARPPPILGVSPRRPVRHNGETVAYVAVLRPLTPNELEHAFFTSTARTLGVLLIAGLGLCLLAALLFSRGLSRPIRQLIEGTRRLANGDYAVTVKAGGSREVAELTETYNSLRQTLARHEQERKQFLADTSHELRTPLAVLQAQVEALQDNIRHPSERFLKSVENQLAIVRANVEDLRRLEQMSVGQDQLNIERAAIFELTDQVATAFQPRFAKAELDLQFAPPDVDVQISVDAEKIQRVFSNLLENSLKYTTAPGIVEINTHIHSDVVELRFEDSSPSVAEKDIEMLFRRSTRGRADINTIDGLGLGLNICSAIVTRHGGTLSAAPSTLGGLCVSIRLPVER